jgi:hypothetical protein
MAGFFQLLIGWAIWVFRLIKEDTKEGITNVKSVNNSISQAKREGRVYYLDRGNMKLLSNHRVIYRKLNSDGDVCLYDKQTHALVYNESKARRKQDKYNKIRQAQDNNLKYFLMPYVYKTQEGKDNERCLPEVVEAATFQPFQLRYVPVPGYGFVMRNAPAIDPNRLYDYVYQYDESKWSEWHVISKEKYVEMSGKPIYEYDQLKYYDLNKIIKD